MKSNNTKKFFILVVEGLSDKLTLEESIARYISSISDFHGVKVRIFCDYDSNNLDNVGGDMTTKRGNIFNNLTDYIKKEIRVSHLDMDDIFAIGLLTDLDACFASEKDYVEDFNTNKVSYDLSNNKVIRHDVLELYDSRITKKNNIIKLFNCNSIIVNKRIIPFRCFYNSINLEHAFYNELTNSPDEKEDYAYEFADEYYDNESFINFISKLNRLGNNYRESVDEGTLTKEVFTSSSNLYYLLLWLKEIIK